VTAVLAAGVVFGNPPYDVLSERDIDHLNWQGQHTFNEAEGAAHCAVVLDGYQAERR
jgi:hypothetical protein